jgi:diguanylate cyclase (GGDEF)-like protein
VLGALFGKNAVAVALVHALLLQWPLLTFIGVRRFHARVEWPAHERSDWTVLAACALLVLSAPLWPADIGQLVYSAAVLGSHLYAASLLVCGHTRADGVPLRILGATLVACALLPMLAVGPGADAWVVMQSRAAATALGAIAMTFIVLVLVFDRTERQLRESRRRLRVLANFDSLTKIPNRRHFHELAAQVLAADPLGSATLLTFDIDHFKHINDHLGHAAGDRALRRVSACVLDVLRARDVPGRQGGDEFALLLRRTSTREAMLVAERLVSRLQQHSAEPGTPPLSLSFGIVQVRSRESLDEAMRRADQALYEAKRQGRSRAVAASGNEHQPVFGESQRLGLTSS